MKWGSPRLDIAEIAREHYATVYRFCARRVGVDRAADVAQETFVTAQRALAKFRSESSLRTWLLGIAHNECRRDSRGHREDPLPLIADVPAGGDCEANLVDRQALRSALAQLSNDHREVVLLHEWEGLTYDEIASILGVPAGTVKSRLHHAFANLRKLLTPAAEEAR